MNARRRPKPDVSDGGRGPKSQQMKPDSETHVDLEEMRSRPRTWPTQAAIHIRSELNASSSGQMSREAEVDLDPRP
jgi:hypothetical protein